VKGLSYFREAARGLLEAYPDARFLIVGEGSVRSDLEDAARALGIAHAVRFAGFRSNVFDIVNALDVFVMPSIHEGVPMALLEAMALGTPVVASAVGGIPEVLDGRRSWLVPPRDVPALMPACQVALTSRRDSAPPVAARSTDQLAVLGQTMCAKTCALYCDLARSHESVGR
jgi:glycosyltransferase involved in cell wall biosynthesis